MRLIAHLIASGLAVWVLSRLIPDQVGFTRWSVLVVFAIVLAVLNTFIRPILKLVTLPLSCLTLGIFAIIVNAVVFYLAAYLSTGMKVTYLGALAGTLLTGVLNGFLESALAGKRRR